MGDIADWYVERMYDHEHDYDEDPPEDRLCQRCGADGLTWIEHDIGWRLHEANGKLHVCPRPAAVIDEFEDLS